MIVSVVENLHVNDEKGKFWDSYTVLYEVRLTDPVDPLWRFTERIQSAIFNERQQNYALADADFQDTIDMVAYGEEHWHDTRTDLEAGPYSLADEANERKYTANVFWCDWYWENEDTYNSGEEEWEDAGSDFLAIYRRLRAAAQGDADRKRLHYNLSRITRMQPFPTFCSNEGYVLT